MARAKRLTGLDPLAYLGVEPLSPPEFTLQQRDPNSNDINFNIGTIWENQQTQDVFILTSLATNVATWTPITGGGGGGALDSITGGNAVVVFGDAGNNITLVNGPNIQTIGNSGAHTIAIQVTSSITIPGDFTTTAGNVNLPQTVDATEGNITFDGDVYFHQYGTNNLFVGESAGNYTTTGQLNAAFGASSLQSLTTGSFNTSLGQFAGGAVDTGSNNTFIGNAAGSDINSGIQNVFIGAGCAQNATTSDNNVCIGYVAGENLSTGGDNICIGSSAGNMLTAGDNNVLIGSSAGAALTTGDDSHIFIGYQAGSAATGMGSPTIAIGYQAAKNLTTAGSSTFIGYQSGNAATTGNGNTFVGYQTGLVLTTGGANTLVGTAAGSSLTTGTTNTFIGNEAGLSATTPTGNVAVGYQAGRAMTTAQANCLVGLGAGALLTTGGNNTFIGDSAGSACTTGTSNTCVGVNAGLNMGAASTNDIYIGNDGASESNTIRIGDTQTTCYIAGIAGVTVSNQQSVVINSATGQLGVGSSSPVTGDNAFFATIDSTLGGTITTSVVYFAGSTAAYTVVSDVDGVFYPGDGVGAPATLTIGATGLYNLTWGIQLVPTAGTTVAVLNRFVLAFIKNATLSDAYSKAFFLAPAGSGLIRVISQTLTGTFSFTAGDVVTFAVYWVGTDSLNFNSNLDLSGITGVSNWISGYRVS